ncbi:MAG: phosphoenolpyruvate kinase, partial [Polyangiaceae bacterium]
MSLDPVLANIVDELATSHEQFDRDHPGEPALRQPVHTVYGGAHLFRHDVAQRLGVRALEALDRHGGDPVTFARAIGLPGCDDLPPRNKDVAKLVEAVRTDRDAARRERPSAWLAVTVFDRVVAKLGREPIEDFRIDFEDGFGPRSDDEEDDAAIAAAHALTRGRQEDTLPPFIGIRIKSLDAQTKRRAARTLQLFFETLADDPAVRGLARFVVTLPKVRLPDEVRALDRMLAHLEDAHGFPQGWSRIEIMTESGASFFGADGRLALASLLEAAEGRAIGVHFGTYDFSASLDVAAGSQSMGHPLCTLALGLMKVGLSGRGVFVSDGATNRLPVGVHRGEGLTKKQRRQNDTSVRRAWALSHANIRRSLAMGLYQGWDVHPAQLPVRYAANYGFFLEELPHATQRLRRFVEAAARASVTGNTFDDAASALGLLAFFARGHQCGALSTDEIERAGVTLAETRERSFAAIVTRRAGS